jgi:hypothetical protein
MNVLRSPTLRRLEIPCSSPPLSFIKSPLFRNFPSLSAQRLPLVSQVLDIRISSVRRETLLVRYLLFDRFPQHPLRLLRCDSCSRIVSEFTSALEPNIRLTSPLGMKPNRRVQERPVYHHTHSSLQHLSSNLRLAEHIPSSMEGMPWCTATASKDIVNPCFSIGDNVKT